MLNWATALPVTAVILGGFGLIVAYIRMGRRHNPNCPISKKDLEKLVREETCAARQQTIETKIDLTRQFLGERIAELKAEINKT